MRDPNSFFFKKHGIALVAGKPNSGRSALIRALKPTHYEDYMPEFLHQRKALFGKLFSLPKDICVAIRTNLPNLHDSSDNFLMELQMTAKMLKHSYIVEWGLLHEHSEYVGYDTYVKYVDTVFVTLGFEEVGEVIHETAIIPRFAGLGEMETKTSLKIRYNVVYHEQSRTIGNPEFTFQIEGDET